MYTHEKLKETQTPMPLSKPKPSSQKKNIYLHQHTKNGKGKGKSKKQHPSARDKKQKNTIKSNKIVKPPVRGKSKRTLRHAVSPRYSSEYTSASSSDDGSSGDSVSETSSLDSSSDNSEEDSNSEGSEESFIDSGVTPTSDLYESGDKKYDHHPQHQYRQSKYDYDTPKHHHHHPKHHHNRHREETHDKYLDQQSKKPKKVDMTNKQEHALAVLRSSYVVV
jgi:hypothetical protein